MVTVAFQYFLYSVHKPKSPKETLDLLKGVSGFTTPGSVTGLKGSSGTDNTALMDVVGGRKTDGTSTDKILNGYEANGLAIRRCTGYYEQIDVHSETPTVHKAFGFSVFLGQDCSLLLQPGEQEVF
ncbi:hypothetical protein DVH05_024534 [Phytophthora capsici]|nr:hypothetical protein DVH05_024534 [Phytophthora capsici]